MAVAWEVTSMAVPTSQVGAVVVLVVRWVARALPPAAGTAVLAGMAAVLFGMAPIGTAIIGIAMITITSFMTTITSAIAS